MLKSEVRSAVFDEVALKVKPLGFQSNKKEFFFIRKFDGGFHRIGFGIVDFSPEIIVTPMIETRLDLLDDVANKFNTVLNPQARPNQTSIQALPEYFSGRPNRYSISTPEELTSKTEEILDVLEKDMLPFAERCVDISFVEKMLTSESGKQLKPDPLRRALTIIAAASLCGRKDIAALGAQTRAQLESRKNSLELQIFDQTLDYILKGETE